MQALADLRVGLGVDDFASNHALLRDLLDNSRPTGVVRLDKSLVKGMLDSDAQFTLTTSLAHLGRDLGCIVFAEGIEDAAAAGGLLDAGVTHAQGFLFCRAIPLDRLTSIETAAQIEAAVVALGVEPDPPVPAQPRLKPLR